MYCKNCGEKLNEGVNFCFNCGFKSGEGQGYCDRCGVKVNEATCSNCGNVIENYKICSYICEKLEEIIGRKKMEALYLDADLLSFIETLSQYDSEENIVSFINSVDSILENWNELSSSTISTEKRKELVQEARNVIESLKDWYKTKKYIEYKDKIITEEEYLQNTILFNKDIKENKFLFKKGI